VSKITGQALRQLFRLYERLRGFNSEPEPAAAPDGLPLPPRALRFRVAGTADIVPFLHGGELAADTVRDLLVAGGRPIEQCAAILDFGCGCGRVLRRWSNLTGAAVYGTDLNPELVAWCQEQLPFASVSVNSAEPPTAYADQQFDAIYAFSVFTHMPADSQRRWLDEFRRILKPGGLLIFSTHGSQYLSRLRQPERNQYLNGEMVVRFASASGSNLCNTFHPEAFVRGELATGWDVAAFTPEGARGNPRQDAWMFQRSA
jgi:2-polyprenyl-3-methyl-5-hydroxy-6-metoxy-1,4-benzoquinol methylase